VSFTIYSDWFILILYFVHVKISCIFHFLFYKGFFEGDMKTETCRILGEGKEEWTLSFVYCDTPIFEYASVLCVIMACIWTPYLHRFFDLRRMSPGASSLSPRRLTFCTHVHMHKHIRVFMLGERGSVMIVRSYIVIENFSVIKVSYY